MKEVEIEVDNKWLSQILGKYFLENNKRALKYAKIVNNTLFVKLVSSENLPKRKSEVLENVFVFLSSCENFHSFCGGNELTQRRIRVYFNKLKKCFSSVNNYSMVVDQLLRKNPKDFLKENKGLGKESVKHMQFLLEKHIFEFSKRLKSIDYPFMGKLE